MTYFDIIPLYPNDLSIPRRNVYACIMENAFFFMETLSSISIGDHKC